jgi:hypothetical protein
MTVSLWVMLTLLLADPLPASKPALSEGLAATFDPALADINVVDTDVEVGWHPTRDPNGSKFSSDLGRLVRTRLETSGLRVFDQTADPQFLAARKSLTGKLNNVDPNTLRWRLANVPVLRVAVDAVSSGQHVPIALYVRTSLSRLVCLDGQNKPSFRATVWSTDPAAESVGSSRWRDEVQMIVLDQVESFITARKAAASHEGEARMVSNAAASAGNAGGAPQYPFVASKNGSVFHRPDCRWAQNISDENLVGYNTREEALHAGKRPCKSCKP